MTDFSDLSNWHAGKDDDFSPVLFVDETIETQTDPTSPIYSEALELINSYVPNLDPSNKVISFRRTETSEEIFQVTQGSGWGEKIPLHMADLRLTLHQSSIDDSYYLEDSREFVVFSNPGGSSLKVTNWKVEHKDIEIAGELKSTFLDTITWVYRNSTAKSMVFNTRYAWPRYKK